MGHGILHYLYIATFLNWLCQYLLFSVNSFCQYLSFFNIFFNRFSPVEKCWVTPHCLWFICFKQVAKTFFWYKRRNCKWRQGWLLWVRESITEKLADFFSLKSSFLNVWRCSGNASVPAQWNHWNDICQRSEVF